MKLALKIIGTVLIILAVGLLFLLAVAIASSSHNISMASRESSVEKANIALVVGSILILAIWFPWKRLFKK
jgi:uncharacterized membrane protein YidH (DUF202 family)